MCFVYLWKIGFVAIYHVDVLSECNIIGHIYRNPDSNGTIHSHNNPHATRTTAQYSASELDFSTTDCFLLKQLGSSGRGIGIEDYLL